MNALKKIYRYPIKGLPGEGLQEVRLTAGQGIPGDRGIGLGNDTLPIKSDGSWTQCEAFHRLTVRPELTKISLERVEGGILITSEEENGSITVNKDTRKIDDVPEISDNEAHIFRARSNQGYWDHADAAISIINLSTVDAIGKQIGVEIDPLRFRANLYVRADPWSEFSWVGRNIQIGSTEMRVRRPIDRCRATSVNVKTGQLDINMPATLAQTNGHIFCGVYASVSSSGTIRPGNIIGVGTALSKEELQGSIEQPTAPPIYKWPRLATVWEIKIESEYVRSVWLEDSHARFGSLANFAPGQYICLHHLSNNTTWRSYTVTAVEKNKIRITVKRGTAAGSRAVHNLDQNSAVIITGPFGDSTVGGRDKSLYLLSAGIGITPTVAKLGYLAKTKFNNPVSVVHIARSMKELVLWNEVLDYANKLPLAEVKLHLTSSDANSSLEFSNKRPDFDAIAEHAKSAEAQVHICGPERFMADVLESCADSEITRENIHVDQFVSPEISTQARVIPASGPVKVTLRRSGITDYWNPEDGTLLDFAESRGAAVPSQCRAGFCQSCKSTILAGAAMPLVGPEGIDRLATLICCSIPKKALELDI